MPPLALWRGVNVRTNDYKFVDRTVGEYFRISGTEIWVHKYLGPIDAPRSHDATQPGGDGVNSTDAPELGIQDVLNMEIRDRKYDPDVYSLKGHYQVSDTEFDLRQFGLFLSNDTIFVTFHLNDMVNSIGRTLMGGDVVELVHRRDDLVIGQDDSISKYYVVQEGTRPSDGWGPTWWSHMWRIKCTPITDSQEYKGILNLPATDVNGDPIPNGNSSNVVTLGDLISTYNREIEITERGVEQAHREVPFLNLQATHFYIIPTNHDPQLSLFVSDDIPPNGSKPVPSGTTFPTQPLIGDYFIRTDYLPAMLFKREIGPITGNGIWVRTQVNWRTSWTPANKLLSTFINNDNKTTLNDGSVVPERQNIRDMLKAKLDPDII
jgi:hypothetical protein